MKRIVMVGLAALSSAQIASAEISINWNSLANTFYKMDGVTLLPASSLFLAFWSADTVIGFNPLNPLNPSGDTYLGHRTTSAGVPVAGRITGYTAGDYFMESAYGKPTDAFVPGYVYIAVVDMPYTVTLTSGALFGKKYVLAPGNPATPQGGLSDATPSSGPPPPPDLMNYLGLKYSTTGTIIPEPGAAILAALGAATAVWIRRRRRDNLSSE